MNFLKSLKEKSTTIASKIKQEFNKLTQENEEVSRMIEAEEISL